MTEMFAERAVARKGRRTGRHQITETGKAGEGGGVSAEGRPEPSSFGQPDE